jgi:hypothetical protein
MLAGVNQRGQHRHVERVELVGAIEPDAGHAIIDRNGDPLCTQGGVIHDTILWSLTLVLMECRLASIR